MENKQVQIQIQKEVEKITINGKSLPKNFMLSMPVSSNDYDIICKMLDPNFLSKELEEYSGKDYSGGICFGLDSHDTVLREFFKRKSQTRLIDGKSVVFMMDYLNKTKLKLVEPESEKLRLSRKTDHPFLSLSKVPKYLTEYIKSRQGTEKEVMDNLHHSFWKKRFEEDEKKKKDIAHYISWNRERQVTERSADLFIPPVPHIKLNLPKPIKNDFLFFTNEINKIAYGLYGQESAFYFNISAELFTDSEAINQINSMLLECPNRHIFFKILNTKYMSSDQFGYFAKKNFQSFLVTLLNLREFDDKRVIGMLNGGGFSYCLLNVVLNFFTDTVTNFPTEGMPKYTGGRHRSLLHPISLAPERIEGVLQQLDAYKSLFSDNSIADKYRGLDSKQFLNKINNHEWSIDARKIGILIWEKLINARLSTDKNKVFDEVINSNFSFLGGILRKIT